MNKSKQDKTPSSSSSSNSSRPIKNIPNQKVKAARLAQKTERSAQKEERDKTKAAKVNQALPSTTHTLQYPTFPRTMSTNDIYAHVHDNMNKQQTTAPFVFNQPPQTIQKNVKKSHAEREAIQKEKKGRKKEAKRISKQNAKAAVESPPIASRHKQQKKFHDSNDKALFQIAPEFEEDSCTYDNWNELTGDIARNDDFVGFTFDDEDTPVVIAKQEESTKKRKRNNDEDDTDVLLSIDPLIPLPMPPWVDTVLHYSKDPTKMLNEEILDYVKYMSPTYEERELRKMLVKRIEKVILLVYPNAKVHVFGSYCTDLYLPSSDMDMVIIEPKARTETGLMEVLSAMQKYKIASKIEFIKAKVPIIKMVDSICGISVDISFNMPGGLESATIIKQFLNDAYIGDATKALILIIKQFLVQRHLNEVFSGGLGSYALVVMIVSFLTMHPLIQARQIKISKNIGVLLIEFLELYGKCVNYATTGIGLDIKTGGYYFQKRDYFDYNDNRICVQDPQDSSNDISRGSFAAVQIRIQLANAFTRLTGIMASLYKRRHDSGLKKTVTILGSIITISKKVIEHRDDNRELYEMLGDLNTLDLLTMQVGGLEIKAMEQTEIQKTMLNNYIEKKTLSSVEFVNADKSENESTDNADDEDLWAIYDQDHSIDDAMRLYKEENVISDSESDHEVAISNLHGDCIDVDDDDLEITSYYKI